MQQNPNMVAVDMGSSYTKVYSQEKGVIFFGDSFAVKNADDSYLDVPDIKSLASMMLPSFKMLRPVSAGEIADIETARAHLVSVFTRLSEEFGQKYTKAAVTVKKGITEMQRYAFSEALRGVNIRDVVFVDGILACAVGSGCDITKKQAFLTVDIGAEKTEAAVIACSDCIAYEYGNIGGNAADKSISEFILRKYGVEIGKNIAEGLKKADIADGLSACGKNCKNGIPAKTAVCEDDIKEAVIPVFKRIGDIIKTLIAKTPVELMRDIVENGIVLTGGCAQIKGLDAYIEEATGIKTAVSKFCAHASVLGAGEISKKYFELKPQYKKRAIA